MFQFRQTFRFVLEKKCHERVSAFVVKKAYPPQIVLSLWSHFPYMKLPIPAHPNHIRERVPGENPFIISQRFRFKTFDCFHATELVKPWQTGIETVFNIDV